MSLFTGLRAGLLASLGIIGKGSLLWPASLPWLTLASSVLPLLDAEFEEAVVLRSIVPDVWPESLLLVLLSLEDIS